ncbi:hypothetical protein llap_10106 [Limosa lapponica baueri]|uniref:Uncharacterized protein n=1 Tax=Limosa lapponica baueri TaxID=1758121 RepID=A0A2I0U0J2_LIMLA|nr:hypothetical protein llap_10106 [Limosa lapponica baueri]
MGPSVMLIQDISPQNLDFNQSIFKIIVKTKTSRKSKSEDLLECPQGKRYSGIFVLIAEQAPRVLKCMPSGLLLKEKDGPVAINSMHQVKSNFLHQSHLVPEGTPFRISLCLKLTLFEHSNTVYRENMKQEEKTEAPEGNTPVPEEIYGQHW